MGLTAKGRLSDCPYIESVWFGRADDTHTVMCPADGRCTIRVAKLGDNISVTLESPLSEAVHKTHEEGIEWVVIKLKLDVYMPHISIKGRFDHDVSLPLATKNSFWLNSETWQIFDFENADMFVDRLVQNDLLRRDPIVSARLAGQAVELSPRTIRHRFVKTIGLPPSTIYQIERARESLTLLQNGSSILDVVYEKGYADQSHLTRSLKRFMGHNPTQIPQYTYSD